MDDIGEVISQIINDPDRMNQVMELAKNLIPPEGNSETMPLSQEQVQAIGKMLQQTQSTEKRQEALVHALRPYLKPGRLSKLERAMQIARVSRLAGLALKKEINT